MKIIVSLLGLFLVLDQSLIAQTTNITWVAQNLPPGLSLTTTSGRTAKVTGRPTTNAIGVYDVVYFPMVSGVAGEMRRVRINVLPSGLNLPQFYAYGRRVTTGTSGVPTFLAGGGGWFFGTVDTISGQTGVFSANGQNFRTIAIPDANSLSAATFGTNSNNTTVIAGRLKTDSSLFTQRSLNQGAFQPIPTPPGPPASTNSFVSTAPYLQSAGLGALGTRAFLLALYGTGLEQSLQINTLEPGATSWITRATLPLGGYFGSEGLQVSLAVQGSVLWLAANPTYSSKAILARTAVLSGLSGWSLQPNPNSITSLASGNGFTLGSTPSGVLKTTNGVNWAWTYRRPVGPLVFSASHQMFFSAAGNSREGQYWLNYDNPGGFDFGRNNIFQGLDAGRVFANQNGAVCLANHQLSPVSVPLSFEYATVAVNVGTIVDFTLEPDE